MGRSTPIVDIPQTYRKHAEAKFFLAHMEERTRRPDLSKQNWEVFGYYLSAFLSAGRSVTLVLKKEAKQRYDATFPGWWDALSGEDRSLLRFMNAQRVGEVHLLGAEARRDTGLAPITEIRSQRVGRPRHVAMMWWISDAPPPKVGVLAPKFEIDGQPADVMVKCRRYVELLEELIRVCEHAGA